jgi:hypothetical protein
MLTIKAYVNDREIECIQIHNTATAFNIMEEIHEYEVLQPSIVRRFHHTRKRGWKPLVIQVLKHLITLEEE